MNCLESRRSLLSTPRKRSDVLQKHIDECTECARFAMGITGLDHGVERAARVRVPESLAERVLLRRRLSPAWHDGMKAIAATLVAAAGLGLAYFAVDPFDDRALPMQAVGPSHPAVAAISLVVDEEPWLLEESAGADQSAGDEGLRRLGLQLNKRDVYVRYVGKCGIPGDGDCDHLVLDTPDGHISVILLPGRPMKDRVLVADRSMTALVTPSRNGAYIVVADSAKVIKRAKRLFVKG
ncbi:MAG: DUF3379 family protein [Burkholderiales bacterium]